MATKKFEKADLNKDGKVTMQEQMPRLHAVLMVIANL